MKPAISDLSAILYTVVYRSKQLARYFFGKNNRRLLRAAAIRYNSGVCRVMWRALRLYLAERYAPDEVLQKGLGNPRVPMSEHKEHFSEASLHPLQAGVNSTNAAVCRDKLIFHSFCDAVNIPVPSIYGVISRYGARNGVGDAIALKVKDTWRVWGDFGLPGKFVAKPRTGNHGRDVRVIVGPHPGEERLSLNDAFLQSVFDELVRSGEDWILEECLENHSKIVGLTGVSGVSTVRVITLVSEDGVEVVDGYFRIIVNPDAITDNVSCVSGAGYTGNILGTVDVTTGQIIEARRANADGIGFELVKHHQNTGVPIPGFVLPEWERVVALVRRAAMLIVPIATVGWDVAITPRGPVLIEANERYQHSGTGEGVIRLKEKLGRAGRRLNEMSGSSDGSVHGVGGGDDQSGGRGA